MTEWNGLGIDKRAVTPIQPYPALNGQAKARIDPSATGSSHSDRPVMLEILSLRTDAGTTPISAKTGTAKRESVWKFEPKSFRIGRLRLVRLLRFDRTAVRMRPHRTKPVRADEAWRFRFATRMQRLAFQVFAIYRIALDPKRFRYPPANVPVRSVNGPFLARLAFCQHVAQQRANGVHSFRKRDLSS
jgi:hypothetical protein